MERPVVLRVAVPAPLPTLFDYLPPVEVDAAHLRPGMRLRVPFGRDTRVGLVVEVVSETDQPRARLKAATELIDREPLVNPEELGFLLRAVGYYHHPVGDALLSAIPTLLRRGRPVVGMAPVLWRVTDSGRAVPPAELTRAPRQALLMRALGDAPAGLDRPALVDRCGDCAATLRTLVAKGWAEQVSAPPEAARIDFTTEAPAVVMNPDQVAAVDKIGASLGRFGAFLLDGVTGSGKTEVYLRLMEQVLAGGGQVLLLVPEIGLTPQLLRRLRRRLPVPLGVLHSGLAAGERARAWLQGRDGEALVVVGTRSAVFTPLPRLALILVDEEHDLSFKQQDGFRYNARDLAVWRARQRHCPVLLGSATPSLETLRNAERGRYSWLRLPQRAGTARPPQLDLIDIRSQPLQAGLSMVLQGLLREELAAGNQVLLFLNRRGFAPVVTCHDCGWVAACPHCDARLTLHQESGRLWCHHCGFQSRLHQSCPECGRRDLRPLGQGTERLEAGLQALYPGVPMARIDRDSTRRKGELDRLITEARRGEHRILLGTQMLAKGHHFPDLTLVGILDLDQGLFGADFRAPERMAQLLIQVAGRAGRADKPGRVILQTRHPQHPLLLTLIRRGYGAFAQAALAERREAELPPFGAQALLRAEATRAESPAEYLRQAVEAAAPLRGPGLELWGPVPAPMERRAGRYRAHLLLQTPARAELQAFLDRWVPELYRLPGVRRVRWSLDVDPQELL